MRLVDVLQVLGEHADDTARFGVTSLSVFGSVARGEAGPSSDIDVLVEFGTPVGLFQVARLQECPESILGVRVDLAMEGALREEMRGETLREAVRAA